MGLTTFTNLGQLGQAEAGVASSLEDQYADLRYKCMERYGADFCNAVLPRNLVYAVTRKEYRPTIPWWGWLLIGAFAHRLVR